MELTIQQSLWDPAKVHVPDLARSSESPQTNNGMLEDLYGWSRGHATESRGVSLFLEQ